MKQDAAAAQQDAFRQEAADLRATIDARLARLIPAEPADGDLVKRAMHEAVLAPGKRLRPLMTLLAARDLGCDGPAAVDIGCALELVHTASLLLDDLPCMDNATLRRGIPPVHVRHGEDVAVLASIALLAQAYGLLAAAPQVSAEQRNRLVGILSDAVGVHGLVGGQYADLRAGGPRSAAEVAITYDRKTGSLFVAALEMVCVIGNSDGECRGRMRTFAKELGQAFQLLDDLLDRDGDQETAGKDVGRDVGKPTLVAVIGRESSRRRLGDHVGKAIAASAGLPRGRNRLGHLVRSVFADALAVRRERAVAEDRAAAPPAG